MSFQIFYKIKKKSSWEISKDYKSFWIIFGVYWRFHEFLNSCKEIHEILKDLKNSKRSKKILYIY